MTTLRDIVDGKDLSCASPIASHVGKHIQDPVGATKDVFKNLSQKRMDYDQAREEGRRQLAPVQTIIDHVSQLHGLEPGQSMPGVNDGELDEYGNPINMQQTPGAMNMNRPSVVGNQPGVAPGSQNQVVPPKLGQASPGSPTARNSPNPKGSSPQSMQQNPAAQSPKGSKSLPGAKGPGDAKVANPVKKAQNSSPGKDNSTNGRQIKIQVHASHDERYTDVSPVEAERSYSDLKFRGRITAASMPIGPGGAMGPSGVLPGNNPASGARVHAKGKKVKALDQTSQKVPGDTANELALNPKLSASKTIDMCAKCGTMHATGSKCKMEAKGSRHGAKKGWSTRGKGHLSKHEKLTHQGMIQE